MEVKAIIVGYSGHAYVACDIFESLKTIILGYCEPQEVKTNPYSLAYLGPEEIVSLSTEFANTAWFIAIGDNTIRQKTYDKLENLGITLFANAVHPKSSLSSKLQIGNCVMIASNVVVNSHSRVENGVILNSGCIVEHQCTVGAFAHIAPGAVLAGNVSVGARTLIGANAVVKQDVKIGKDVVVGAGAVILNDISDRSTVVGNPGRIIKTSL